MLTIPFFNWYRRPDNVYAIIYHSNEMHVRINPSGSLSRCSFRATAQMHYKSFLLLRYLAGGRDCESAVEE